MTEHELRCWPKYFSAIESGSKNFEIRYNDRGFKVGDTLLLCEWEPETKKYTGKQLRCLITYITDYEQQLGYVVMGLGPDPTQAYDPHVDRLVELITKSLTVEGGCSNCGGMPHSTTCRVGRLQKAFDDACIYTGNEHRISASTGRRRFGWNIDDHAESCTVRKSRTGLSWDAKCDCGVLQ